MIKGRRRSFLIRNRGRLVLVLTFVLILVVFEMEFFLRHLQRSDVIISLLFRSLLWRHFRFDFLVFLDSAAHASRSNRGLKLFVDWRRYFVHDYFYFGLRWAELFWLLGLSHVIVGHLNLNLLCSRDHFVVLRAVWSRYLCYYLLLTIHDIRDA